MNPAERYRTNEHRLIDEIKGWVGSSHIGDDCAVLPGGLLVTTDMLVEGTHFLRSLMSLQEIGAKAVAVNVSDVAAMSGKPRHIFVCVSAPATFSRADFRNLYAGINEAASIARAHVSGGDVTRGPQLVLSLTVVAQTHDRGVMLRSGAEPGDVVIVTGDFGASVAGMWLLQQGESSGYCQRRHIQPEPRLAESWQLVEAAKGRGALMDASDGLADALAQIARMSEVGLDIHIDEVPVHEETVRAAERAGVELYDWVLYGGEDYELVGAVAPDAAKTLSPDSFKIIGTVTKATSINLLFHGKVGPELDLRRCFQQVG